jgi:hypothetical protein
VTTEPFLTKLHGLDWTSVRHYRVLSHYLVLRATTDAVGYVHRVLASFEVDEDPTETRSPRTPNVPPEYGLVGTDGGLALYFGRELLIEGDDERTVLEHLLWHVHSEALRQTGDFFLVHAGAVRSPAGRGVLLPASTGSGKTTTTLGLVRGGFDYLSDEAGAIDPVSGSLHPFPKALTLKRGGYDAAGGLVPEAERGYAKHWVLPAEIGSAAIGEPCPVGAVAAVRWESGASVRIEPMSRADAATELWRNAFNAARYGGRGLTLMERVLAGAACARVTFGNLDDAVKAIADLVDGSSR